MLIGKRLTDTFIEHLENSLRVALQSGTSLCMYLFVNYCLEFHQDYNGVVGLQATSMGSMVSYFIKINTQCNHIASALMS